MEVEIVGLDVLEKLGVYSDTLRGDKFCRTDTERQAALSLSISCSPSIEIDFGRAVTSSPHASASRVKLPVVTINPLSVRPNHRATKVTHGTLARLRPFQRLH